MKLPSRHDRYELYKYLYGQAHWKTIACWLSLGLVLLVIVVWFGREMVDEIENAESWIESHGALGWAVFVVLVVVFISVFVPLAIPAIAAGAMFGYAGGVALTFVAAVLAAVIEYLAAQHLFRTKIEAMLDRHPKLRAIQQAINHQGPRLQILLRMGPVSAATVSYVLGATGSRFSTFLIATVGLLPSVLVNVYFGYAASHVTKSAGNADGHSTLQLIGTIVGLVVCTAVMISITRIATRAIADSEVDMQVEESPC